MHSFSDNKLLWVFDRSFAAVDTEAKGLLNYNKIYLQLGTVYIRVCVVSHSMTTHFRHTTDTQPSNCLKCKVCKRTDYAIRWVRSGNKYQSVFIVIALVIQFLADIFGKSDPKLSCTLVCPKRRALENRPVPLANAKSTGVK